MSNDMSHHVTSEQISEFVAGAVSSSVQEHIQACPACRSEAERLNETLALFGQSVRRWSLEQEHARPVPSPRLSNLRQLGWTLALAACLIAGLVLPHSKTVTPTPIRNNVSSISDAELLVQVNRELSEAVPPSMAPIALRDATSTTSNEVKK
jgi:ferric-dicitrate binding protein FerR (iron transport regulator)